MTPERYAKLKRVLATRQPDLTVLMDNVHKTHNIAAILRTCDAVGILDAHGVSTAGEIPRHHMVSGGTRKYVRTHLHPDINRACRHVHDAGCQILAAHLSETARDYREFDYTQPTAFLLGAELWGVSRRAAELADDHVCIPMHGMVSSLNVSVAGALLLYEARRQREHAGLYDMSRLPVAVHDQILFEWAHPQVAARCRDKRLPYPALTADGDLTENPFANPDP